MSVLRRKNRIWSILNSNGLTVAFSAILQSMEKGTAKSLVDTVRNIVESVLDAKARLKALEDAVKEKDPALYTTYQKKLESLPTSTAYNDTLDALYQKLTGPGDGGG